MLCYADCSLPCVGTSSCFYTLINVSKGILCYVKWICDELLMTELAMVEDSVVGWVKISIARSKNNREIWDAMMRKAIEDVFSSIFQRFQSYSKANRNIATGETSWAIASSHFLNYFHFFLLSSLLWLFSLLWQFSLHWLFLTSFTIQTSLNSRQHFHLHLNVHHNQHHHLHFMVLKRVKMA